LTEPVQGNLGATVLGPQTGSGTGLLVEAILTYTVVSTIWATAIDKENFGIVVSDNT
jgi:hypothetical protein